MSTGASGRIPSLDGLRAVSVLIVMVAHAGYGAVVPGGLGVTVFFFLSGFLITRLLYEEYTRTRSINLPYFYLRRFLRLSPPLYLTLAVAYGLTALGALPGQISWVGALSQIGYLANYYELFWAVGHGAPGGTGILWSLAVEEHFYLVFPPLLLWLLRRRSPLQILLVLAAACAAALAWRYRLVDSPGFVANRTYYATDTRFDSIIYGSLFALYDKFGSARPEASGYRAWRAHSGALALAGVALIALTLVWRDAAFRETWRYTLQGIGLMPIFMHCTTRDSGPVVGWLNSPVAQRLGVYSYAMYLIHFIVINAIQRLPPFAGNRPLIFVTALVAAVAFAAFVDRVVEPRFRRLRHRYAA